MQRPIIEVKGLSKRYVRGMDRPLSMAENLAQAVPVLSRLLRSRGARKGDDQAFWALKDVSFDVAPGERIGIIGRNGAGKSTLLKVLSRIVTPTEGEARIRGRVASLLEVGTGFNPALTGRENVYLNGSIHGLERREVDEKLEEIIEFSGIRDFIDTPVRHYSSGMFMRLAFSVAAHLDPDILMLDEVLAVGDLSFQQKSLKRVEGLTSEGRTVLFVSHATDAVTRLCTRCIWLEHGRVVMDGPSVDVVEAYVQELMQVRAERQWEAPPPSDVPAEPPAAADTVSDDVAPDGETATAPEPTPAPSLLPPAPPGDEWARLVSARVVGRDGQPAASVAVHEPVGIEVVYDVLQEGRTIVPGLHFKTAQDAWAFAVAFTDPSRLRVPTRPGRHTATAWVPPNLLNTGIYYVHVAIVTPDPLERHCRVERAVSFNVHEVFSEVGLTARGLYTRNFPGPVRPLLRWETRGPEPGTVSEPAVAAASLAAPSARA